MGNLKLRAGYGYADDPLLSTVKVGKHIASIGGVNSEGNTYTSPMYGLFMSYFQAMETPVIYKHRLAVGLGVENFLGVPFLSLDSHAAVQLKKTNVLVVVKLVNHCLSGYYNSATIGTALAGGLANRGCTINRPYKSNSFIFPLRWCFNLELLS